MTFMIIIIDVIITVVFAVANVIVLVNAVVMIIYSLFFVAVETQASNQRLYA